MIVLTVVLTCMCIKLTIAIIIAMMVVQSLTRLPTVMMAGVIQ